MPCLALFSESYVLGRQYREEERKTKAKNVRVRRSILCPVERPCTFVVTGSRLGPSSFRVHREDIHTYKYVSRSASEAVLLPSLVGSKRENVAYGFSVETSLIPDSK